MTFLATLWALVRPFWVYAAVAVLALAVGFSVGANSVYKKWDKASAESLRESAKQTSALANATELLRQQHEIQIESIRSKLDAANASLRDRPNRLPNAAAATCKGSTGTELARQDAEFLVGEAADSDRWKAEVIACYAREDALREAMIGNRK